MIYVIVGCSVTIDELMEDGYEAVSVFLLLFILKSDNEDFEKYIRYRIKYLFQKNDQLRKSQ